MDNNVKEIVASFFQKYTPKHYTKGAILIRADEIPQGIFFLEDGVVRQHLITKNGSDITFLLYKPFSFFPMMWAFNAGINHYNFEAFTSIKVRIAPKEQFISFIEREPKVMIDLLHRLFRGTEGLFIIMEQLLSGNAYSKLTAILALYAKRFGVEKDGSVCFSLTEKDLASQAGISRETVSRELRTMEKRGLVRHSVNQICIFDLQKLKKEISLF